MGWGKQDGPNKPRPAPDRGCQGGLANRGGPIDSRRPPTAPRLVIVFSSSSRLLLVFSFSSSASPSRLLLLLPVFSSFSSFSTSSIHKHPLTHSHTHTYTYTPSSLTLTFTHLHSYTDTLTLLHSHLHTPTYSTPTSTHPFPEEPPTPKHRSTPMTSSSRHSTAANYHYDPATGTYIPTHRRPSHPPPPPLPPKELEAGYVTKETQHDFAELEGDLDLRALSLDEKSSSGARTSRMGKSGRPAPHQKRKLRVLSLGTSPPPPQKKKKCLWRAVC